jgi:hypothetical protein
MLRILNDSCITIKQWPPGIHDPKVGIPELEQIFQ